MGTKECSTSTEDAHHTIIEKWLFSSFKLKLFLLTLFVASFIILCKFSQIVAANSGAFVMPSLSVGQMTTLSLCVFVILWGIANAFISHIPRARALCITEESAAVLRAGAELSVYILLMFVFDRSTLLPSMKKWYTPDSFWFMWISLVVFSLFTITKAKSSPHTVINGEPTQTCFHVPPLAREQTEEWKGWMQILFLWYHYFHNTSIYNSIRLFIAAYVWMTGFGNFSYYYVRKDFSFARFCDMQWRLNFLVFVVCFVMGNQYMLYYICPLHTFFTLVIYGSLYIFREMNCRTKGLLVKVGVLFGTCFLLWDVSDEIFFLVWVPLKWLLRYDDPYTTGRPVMSEWHFRTFLDHYIWIYGMLCAYFHPTFDAFLRRLDALQWHLSWAVKSVIVAFALLVGYLYTVEVYLLPKKNYNALHPYTSFIPITVYLVLRNISMRGRMYHIGLFSALGKVTLESYIAQFHIWMLTRGKNLSPKLLLLVVPENYPMVNFALTSILLFVVSFRLFATTNATRPFVLPPKASALVLATNILTVLVFICMMLVVSYFVLNRQSR